MRTVGDFWTEMMGIPESRWIVFGTLLICATLVAIYVSAYFRNLALGKNDDNDADILSGFRKLRDNGQLEEAEYSKLKRAIPVDGNSGSSAVGQPRSVTQPTNPEKPFLTLAEAESKKREPNPEVDLNENNQADPSD